MTGRLECLDGEVRGEGPTDEVRHGRGGDVDRVEDGENGDGTDECVALGDLRALLERVEERDELAAGGLAMETDRADGDLSRRPERERDYATYVSVLNMDSQEITYATGGTRAGEASGSGARHASSERARPAAVARHREGTR